MNPKYPNGNELCDVLILHDRNISILQCKTKRLRYDSKIGKELKLIRDDLDKETLKALGPSAATIAKAEGLDAHAQAVNIRLSQSRTKF